MSNLPEIPGFTVLSPLGKGGMGEVFLARDESLGRRVAMKLISGGLSGLDDEVSRERFLREARTMASLSHPNLTRVHSMGEVGGRIYLVMELLEGGSLADRIQERGSLSVREALEITGQVCDGLTAAWEKSIVHRDIKPSNILFDTHGTAKVADFGLAKPLHDSQDLKLTRTGFIVGSPHYLSPEHASEKEVDIRSDIYSLGIVLYEMLTGSPPFKEESYFGVIARHLSGPVPDVNAVRQDVPGEVSALVRRMTRRDPAERLASPGAVRAEIDRLLPRLDSPPPRRKRQVRSPAILGAVALLVIGVALAGLALGRTALRPGPPSPQPPPSPLPHPLPAPPPERAPTPPEPPALSVGPEASPAQMARVLAGLHTGGFGLELSQAPDSPPRWQAMAHRSAYPILLVLGEDGDLRRLLPAGFGAGDPLPSRNAVLLPLEVSQRISAGSAGRIWIFLIATEKPLAQPVILGARPVSDLTTLYPRRVGTAELAYPAHSYLRWLINSLGTAAGGWDAATLNPDQGGKP